MPFSDVSTSCHEIKSYHPTDCPLCNFTVAFIHFYSLISTKADIFYLLFLRFLFCIFSLLVVKGLRYSRYLPEKSALNLLVWSLFWFVYRPWLWYHHGSESALCVCCSINCWMVAALGGNIMTAIPSMPWSVPSSLVSRNVYFSPGNIQYGSLHWNVNGSVQDKNGSSLAVPEGSCAIVPYCTFVSELRLAGSVFHRMMIIFHLLYCTDIGVEKLSLGSSCF